METIRIILWAVLGTLCGLIVGALCGSAMGLIGTPQNHADNDWGMLIGAVFGVLIGLTLGLCIPSWRHNHWRKKRLQTLLRQRGLRSFTSNDDIWPPPPTNSAGAGAAASTK